MSEQLYIVDHQLPETQDFTALKKSALDFLKAHSGQQWSNFNPSDPGVTILDQVCFALTELGYCNDFPIEDILTIPNGCIDTKNQFYLPQTILTTSALTADDYRKYLIDSTQGVQNAVVVVIKNKDVKSNIRFIYGVYLLVDDRLNQKQRNNICTAAYYNLSRSRNIGELFLKPQILTEFLFTIKGDVEIDSQVRLDDTLAAINTAIRQYIFPAAIQQGFDNLRQQGYSTSEIFEGPLLVNGWFTPQTLGVKKTSMTAAELMNVIGKVKGVDQVGQLTLWVNGKKVSSLDIPPGFLPVLHLNTSLSADLRINGQPVKAGSLNTLINKPQGIKTGDVYLDMVEQKDHEKSGRYRDIANYYSIQNTFPAIFAIGADATVGSSKNYASAQTRQLKAYLTLFDQVLANQFAQLAGVRHLFSFKNSLTAAPTEITEYYSTMNAAQRTHPEYPAPYISFSPTYYYRSLYDVPNIRPLLKDNDIKRFYTGQQTVAELDQDSWEAFKHDPYNAYIHGLSEFVENDSAGISRRNAMLDHLLARHGESPLEIDEMLKGSVYSGDALKDLVIFKSLYLQNLGLLSYFRLKGYNALAAQKILPVSEAAPPNFEDEILKGNNRNFIFDSAKIDHLEKLTMADFDNYSAIELKLNLFFGLRMMYLNFMLCHHKDKSRHDEIRYALWMITQRKGLILIESCLLHRGSSYQVILTKDPKDGPWFQVGNSLSYQEAHSVVQKLADHKESDYQNEGITVDGKQYHLSEMQQPQQQNKFFKRIPGKPYYFSVKIDGEYEIGKFDEFPEFKSDLEFVFPDFIALPNIAGFKNRVDNFLKRCLPVHLSYEIQFLGIEQLKNLIPVFIRRHNQLIFKPTKDDSAA
jgi:hypothetical protein